MEVLICANHFDKALTPAGDDSPRACRILRGLWTLSVEFLAGAFREACPSRQLSGHSS